VTILGHDRWREDHGRKGQRGCRGCRERTPADPNTCDGLGAAHGSTAKFRQELHR
jgi:hypothetical protein